MMAVIQISFFFLLTVQNMNPCLSALSSLRFINGYNSLSLSNNIEDQNLPSQPKGIFLFSQFFENYNITIILIFIPLLSGLVAFILSKTLLKDNKKVEYVWRRLVGEYTLTGLMISAYIVSCSSGL